MNGFAVDILERQTHTPEFLKKNPDGKIPLLELDDGRYLSESNAILSYLAEGTVLWRGDRFAKAKIMQWMFFEQYSHEPYIAVARFIARYLGLPDDRRAEVRSKAGWRSPGAAGDGTAAAGDCLCAG